jgi:L-ribulose-5-phosphate 3-epimerase
MKLGYNTNGLQNHRLDDALRLLADHGYEAVALTLDVVHLDPFRAVTAAEVASTATLLDALGLEAVIETGARFLLDPRQKHEPTLMTRGSEARAKRLAFLDRAAAIGADLGASVVSFWVGIDRDPGVDSWDRVVDGVGAAVKTIRSRGLVPALEPEPGMAVATMAEFDRLCADLGAEAPALALDVGHLYVTESEEAPVLCHRYAARCAQVHLEDMRRGVHDHLPPGDGDVDFPAVLTGLEEGGYRGPVCFELSRSSHAAPDLVARCRDVFRASTG